MLHFEWNLTLQTISHISPKRVVSLRFALFVVQCMALDRNNKRQVKEALSGVSLP